MPAEPDPSCPPPPDASHADAPGAEAAGEHASDADASDADAVGGRAVIDRIVDGRTAVLLIEPDETELQLPVAALPSDADEGSWVVLDADNAVIAVDHALTAARRDRAEARLARLRQTRTRGRFRGGRFGDGGRSGPDG